tara:strand:+ start:262 stop:489 length:228 start_codon:yes stop_codon:yes gene_type:complete
MPSVIKKKKIKQNKKTKDVDFSTPYKGAEGVSKSRETAKTMWTSKASKDELDLGFVLTQDSDGNYIARTRLQSKA